MRTEREEQKRRHLLTKAMSSKAIDRSRRLILGSRKRIANGKALRQNGSVKVSMLKDAPPKAPKKRGAVA